jgi:uncharacterized protein
MKLQIVIFSMWLSVSALTGQTATKSADSTCENRMKTSKLYLDGIKRQYNPAKAFQLYSECASLGVPKAMNTLGNLYLQGTGTAADPKLAEYWYLKAANANYVGAWSNLGVMYKYAHGVAQDFTKAFGYFGKGAAAGDNGSMFYLGCLDYKGLGCPQNYSLAYQWFSKSADENLGSMYMLGLCLRNGYGTARDTAAGNQWLREAAAHKYQQAINELAQKEPENKTTELDVVKTINTQSRNFRRVRHDLGKSGITGSYSGYMVTYDWSGAIAVAMSPLKVDIVSDKNTLTARWYEGDSLAATIAGVLTDTAIVFGNERYRRPEHYHPSKPLAWEFKKASLELVSKGKDVFIAGNVNFYLPELMEPAKPMYITLTKDKAPTVATKSNLKSAVDTTSATNQKALSGLVAWPNPFSGELRVSFTLATPGSVQLRVASMSGTEVFNTPYTGLDKGSHTLPLQLSIPAGAYIVKVTTGNGELSAIVIKQ